MVELRVILKLVNFHCLNFSRKVYSNLEFISTQQVHKIHISYIEVTNTIQYQKL